MSNLNQQLQTFLADNFKDLVLRQPLFYNWPFSLRFNLQEGEVGSESYFKEVLQRSHVIFNSVFQPQDDLLFVLVDYRFKRRKLHLGNFCLQCIDKINRERISFKILRHLYEKDKYDRYNRALVKCKAKELKVISILKAIAHKDFPGRTPRLGKNDRLSSKDLYLINLNKKMIFHMYDDRGLDLLASNKENLIHIYQQYNAWLLDYDRNKMFEVFG